MISWSEQSFLGWFDRFEVKRANMPADLGYAVFALNLFGAGMRPVFRFRSGGLEGD